MNKYQKAFVPTLIFFFTILLVLFIRQLDSQDKQSMYRRLQETQMPSYFKQLLVESKDKHTSDTHQVTRQQLGRNSWQFLHMVSGSMPDNFDNELQAKTNLFLNLFAQYYPCKLCGTHFLQHLKNTPFLGNTKSQFMHYICNMHNIVNKDLGKPIYSCENIVKEWSSCGCGGG